MDSTSGGSSSSSTYTAVQERLDLISRLNLDKSVLDHYRKAVRGTAVSFVVYRINCWKVKGSNNYVGLTQMALSPDDEAPYVISGEKKLRCNVHNTYCEHEKVSTPHCEIWAPKYPDDFIWIKDLQSEHGTYVNGRIIPTDVKYKLVDCDIISLGEPHDYVENDFSLDDKEKRGYVFRVMSLKRYDKQLHRRSRTDVPNPVSVALGNTVILDTILSYLPHKNLKSSRLVNKFWKNRTDCQIFPKTRLNFMHDYGTQNLFGVTWQEKFRHNASLLEKYSKYLPNWEIYFSSYYNRKTGISPQFYNMVSKVLKKSGHIVRDAKVKMTILSKSEEDTFWEVLGNLQQVEVVHLVLETKSDYGIFTKHHVTPFPRVKHLTISLDRAYTRGNGDNSLCTGLKYHVVLELAKVFPNLESISPSGNNQVYQNILQCMHWNSHQIWNRVNAISLKTLDDTAKGCRLITALPQPLLKIHLRTGRHLLNQVTVDILETMLRRHAGTLEDLGLWFEHSTITNEQGQEQPAKPVLKFPQFPRLKKLEIVLNHVCKKELQIQLQFPSEDSICYERDLPEIRNLILWPEEWVRNGCYRHYFNLPEAVLLFLPTDSESVSQSMRSVDFKLKEIGKEDEGYEMYMELLRLFQKIFPYVNHQQVIKGLQSL